jgi:carbonic anhydrase
MIDEILNYNRDYVARKGYEEHVTDKYPDKRLAILTCMDTRLTRLLPDALGLKNGNAKLIKNAGGLISDPWGNEIRSLLVAIFELHCNEVMVIHHTHCGAAHMNAASMIEKMKEHGISEQVIVDAHKNAFDFDAWLEGFGDTEESVRRTVAIIREHPLIPKEVTVRGFIIDSTTGELKEVK